MEYNAPKFDKLVQRPGAMEMLKKPSLIGGNLYKSIFAEKQQSIADKKEK